MGVVRAAGPFESLIFFVKALHGGISILEHSVVCTSLCSSLAESERSVPLPVKALG